MESKSHSTSFEKHTHISQERLYCLWFLQTRILLESCVKDRINVMLLREPKSCCFCVTWSNERLLLADPGQVSGIEVRIGNSGGQDCGIIIGAHSSSEIVIKRVTAPCVLTGEQTCEACGLEGGADRLPLCECSTAHSGVN